MENIEDKKISKGYRLRPETHKMIKDIKIIISGDADDALNIACSKFLKELSPGKKLKKEN